MAHSLKVPALLIALLLAGCASIDVPPDHWPAPLLADSNECPDLTGSYSNDGVGVKGKKSTRLAVSVFPEAAKNWTAADVKAREKFAEANRINIYGPEKDRLTIEAWKDHELIGKLERTREHGDGFRCKAGAVQLSLPVYAEAQGGVFITALRDTAMMRADNGSLIVKSSDAGVGLGFYIIPLAMRFETWSLYAAMPR